jgi:hypothetical protein
MIAESSEQPMHPSAVDAAFYGPASAQIDNSPRAQRLRRVRAAREMLVRRGHTANSAVFVTAAEFLDDSDLEDAPRPNKPQPQVCEVTGHYAAYLIADRTHRLSNPEEIDRFRREQRAREEQCAKAEAANPNHKHVHQTINYVMAPGDQPAGIAPAAAGEPARSSRNLVAGEKDKK